MQDLKITDVRAHPGDSAFLLDNGETAILYDSGFAFTGDAVAKNIQKQLGDRPLDNIFLTHSHYDHALGAAYALQYWPKAQVVAGEYAVGIFQKPSAKRVMRELDRKFAEKCGIFEYEDRIDELRVDLPVKDGDRIRAGAMEFIAVNLPGHTRCSVAYYEPERKLLLGSETLGVYDGEETIIPSYLIGVQTTLDSIRKAEQLEIKHLLLPHYGLLSPEQTQFYLGNAYQVAAETAEAITALLKSGSGKADIMEYFKAKFMNEKVRAIYPPDAMELNTSIMIDLIEREMT